MMLLQRSMREELGGRRTMHDYAQRLRAFFLYAEARIWCRTGLAAGIMAPRLMADEDLRVLGPRVLRDRLSRQLVAADIAYCAKSAC